MKDTRIQIKANKTIQFTKCMQSAKYSQFKMFMIYECLTRNRFGIQNHMR